MEKQNTKKDNKKEIKKEAVQNQETAPESTAESKEKKEVKKVEKSAPKAEKKDGVIKYHNIIASCACGAEYQTGSTLENIRVDICANCHPFFTGEKKILDSEGRVEKFRKKYKTAEKK